MCEVIKLNSLPPPPRGRSQSTQARPSPALREREAALTLDPVRGEVRADFCHLGVYNNVPDLTHIAA